MEFRDKRVTVMGLGSFGGGLGAVQFLLGQGARVTVTDLRSAAELSEPLQAISETHPSASLELHLGGHQSQDFTDTDLVVVNPAVPSTCPYVALARQAGVPLSSEMNLFWQLNPAPVIAITGSNGKSTTTAMTHSILQATGRRCWLGGNIGRSLLPLVHQIQPSDWVILELSSFQLEQLGDGGSAHVAIVTNFSPNHLDRHGTLENYRTAKQALLNGQRQSDYAILNQDDPDVSQWPTKGHRLNFGLSDQGRDGLFANGQTAVYRFQGREQFMDVPQWVTLPGMHNVQNALAAACAVLALGTAAASIEQGLREYRALPHRLELVAERHERKFYNDSLATTPESAIVALAAFQQPIVLFAGGYDKGSDLTEFARAIADSTVKSVALMGTTAPRLWDLLDQFDPHRRVQRKICESFENAFEWAVAQSGSGDIILMSPGCASYDWFRNFADRGIQFRQRAEEYVAR